MSILLDRILLLCEAQNTNLYRIEKDLVFSSSSMRKWEESIPSGDKIQKVADYFDVSIDYLMGRTDNPRSHKCSLENIVPAVTQINGAVDRVKNELEHILTEHNLYPIPVDPAKEMHSETDPVSETDDAK